MLQRKTDLLFLCSGNDFETLPRLDSVTKQKRRNVVEGEMRSGTKRDPFWSFCVPRSTNALKLKELP